MEYKIISVESRKGGVGKTTAALNISQLLIEKEYAVLLLDIDITGTSISGSYDSSFWIEKIHPVNLAGKDKNLLELFQKTFLTGGVIPQFSFNTDSKHLTISKDRINTLGSEIYGDGSNLICDPRILFDELHSFWLVEMIENICESFTKCCIGKKVAIVLDNSPGYVGLGRAVHEWLTDIGPERGKFLTVSSLDVQDLNSCINAIMSIESMVSDKMEGAGYYHTLKRGRDSSTMLKFESKRIFNKLATGEDPSKFRFYSNAEESLKPELHAYQSLIINKAPHEIKSDLFQYDFEKSLGRHREKCDVLYKFIGEPNKEKLKGVVYYDNYTHFQFIEPYIIKAPPSSGQLSSLKGYFTRIEKEIVENQKQLINYSRLFKVSDTYENTLVRLIAKLNESGYSNVTRLIEECWHPSAPFKKAQKAFNFLWGEMPFIMNSDEDVPENIYSDNNILNRIIKERTNNNIDNFTISHQEEYLNSFRTLWYLFFEPHIRHNPSVGNMTLESLLNLFVVIQRERMQKSKMLRRVPQTHNIQYFLANENMNSMEFKKYSMILGVEIIPHRMHGVGFHEIGRYADFYNALCHAQARLIDLHNDFKFLIQVVKEIVITDSHEQSYIFPNIRDILNDVIVKKKMPFSDAGKRMGDKLRGAQYMHDFREVLKDNVLSKWEL